MKFGDLVDYEAKKYWLNFGSDVEHILDIVVIIVFPVG